MKKSFIIVAIAVLVLTFAGSAWAHGGNSTGRRSGGGHMAYCGSAQNQSFGHHMMRRTQPGMGFRNSSNRPFDQRDIPQDILNKRDEMRRTHLELRLELAQPQVNRRKPCPSMKRCSTFVRSYLAGCLTRGLPMG